MIQLLKNNKTINGFCYPESIYKLLELGLVDFDVWYFMDAESVKERLEGLKLRYPNRQLLPFARRGDCDDIACFEMGMGERVYIIHDFSSSGYEQKEIFDSVWEWLRYVIDIMIEYEKMEGIE